MKRGEQWLWCGPGYSEGLVVTLVRPLGTKLWVVLKQGRHTTVDTAALRRLEEAR